jgi:hypothetical protein
MFIDPFRNDWLVTLEERATSQPDDVNVFLLLDGVFVPGMHRTRPFIDSRTKAPHLLFEALPGCTDQIRDASPFLVPIRPAGGSLAPRLASCLAPCSGMPMVSAIATTEDLDQLGRRLAAWCVIENDAQRFNFRFPDTRRLPGIYAALTAEQRAQLCGPMCFWAYIGRDGAWMDLDVVGQDSNIASNPELNNEQFGRMVDDGIADEILFRMTYGGVAHDGLHSDLHAIVCSALATAHAGRLEETLRFEWCMHIVNDGREHDTATGLAAWRASVVEDVDFSIVG